MSVGAGGYTGAADPKGPVAGYDPVLGKVDRRNKKQKNYPKEYVQMFRDAKKGNRLKSVLNNGRQYERKRSNTRKTRKSC